jgi:hypothetical protein
MQRRGYHIPLRGTKGKAKYHAFVVNSPRKDGYAKLSTTKQEPQISGFLFAGPPD